MLPGQPLQSHSDSSHTRKQTNGSDQKQNCTLLRSPESFRQHSQADIWTSISGTSDRTIPSQPVIRSSDSNDKEVHPPVEAIV